MFKIILPFSCHQAQGATCTEHSCNNSKHLWKPFHF